MTCTIRNGLDTTPLHLYRYLRKKGYAHRSAVTSVLMYYSPNKEDLCRRLERRREYYKGLVVMPDRTIEELVKCLESLTRQLPGLSTSRQIEELNIMAATTQWVADRLNADLALERRLKEVKQ